MSWDGFAELGIPLGELSYDSDRGAGSLALERRFQPVGESIKIPGRWLEWRGSSGLVGSWERFELKLSAALVGPQSAAEDVNAQLDRLNRSYPKWGWQADNELAQTPETNGWKVRGAFQHSKSQRRMLLVQRGERVMEITLAGPEDTRTRLRKPEIEALLSQL